MSEFAIGDIHGCAGAFRLLLGRIQPGASDTVVLLGDYIDRGPDSCAVLDTVSAHAILHSGGFETGLGVTVKRGGHL
jgi:hypothetical protein